MKNVLIQNQNDLDLFTIEELNKFLALSYGEKSLMILKTHSRSFTTSELANKVTEVTKLAKDKISQSIARVNNTDYMKREQDRFRNGYGH